MHPVPAGTMRSHATRHLVIQVTDGRSPGSGTNVACSSTRFAISKACIVYRLMPAIREEGRRIGVEVLVYQNAITHLGRLTVLDVGPPAFRR